MKHAMLASLVLATVFLGYQQVRSMDDKMEKPMDKMAEHTRSAVFAGGCFWCTESDFEKVDGVKVARDEAESASWRIGRHAQTGS